MGRPQRHFELIQSILKIIAENNFKYKIRINTLVSKINYSNMLELANELLKYNVDKWRIYQFAPLRERARDNKDTYFVDYQMFLDLESDIKQHPITSEVDVSFYNIDKLQNENLMISPNGDILKSIECKDYVFKNILNN